MTRKDFTIVADIIVCATDGAREALTEIACDKLEKAYGNFDRERFAKYIEKRHAEIMKVLGED